MFIPNREIGRFSLFYQKSPAKSGDLEALPKDVRFEQRFFAHKSVLFGGQIKAAQISISSSHEHPVCLVCSETVGVTKEFGKVTIRKSGKV